MNAAGEPTSESSELYFCVLSGLVRNLKISFGCDAVGWIALTLGSPKRDLLLSISDIVGDTEKLNDCLSTECESTTLHGDSAKMYSHLLLHGVWGRCLSYLFVCE